MKNRTKSALALLLAVIFLFTSIFTDGLVLKTTAADNESASGESGLVSVTKTVSGAISEDGGVDITLEVNVGSKDYVEYDKYDIVLLLDASVSMEKYVEKVTNAAKSFIQTLQDANVGDSVRVAVIGFNTESSGYIKNFEYLINEGTKDFTSLSETVNVNQFKAQGNTPIAEALDEAKDLFDKRGLEDANKVVILFTDGQGSMFYDGLGFEYSSRRRAKEEYCNELAIDAVARLKEDGAKIYAINYQSADYSASRRVSDGLFSSHYHYEYDNAIYFETMLVISSEDSGLTKKQALDKNKDIPDLSVFKDYYFTASVEKAEELSAVFANVAKEAVNVETIGFNTSVAEVLPEYFHVDVNGAENAVLKSATDNKGNDISDLVSATYDADKNLRLKIGTLEVAEDGTRSLGNLETGTYTIVYTAKLDAGTTADDLVNYYGEDANHNINIVFQTPAIVSYYETNEDGSIPESPADAKEIQVESNIVDTQANVCVVSFYINNEFVESKLAMKNSSVSAPAITVPENGRYRVINWYVLGENGEHVDATETLNNVPGSVNVYGGYVQQFTVEFYVDGKQVGQTQIVDEGAAATAPEVVIPDTIDNAEKTVEYEFSGWDKDFGNVTEDLRVSGTIIDNTTVKEYTYTVKFLYEDGTVAAQPVVATYKVGDRVPGVEVPAIEGYTPDVDAVSASEMPAKDVEVIVTYTINKHTVTINYVFEDGETAEKTVVLEVEYKEDYRQKSPEIIGYTPDKEVVSGTMDDEDVEITVTYKVNTYTLTIEFVFEDGTPAADPIVKDYDYDTQTEDVVVPAVENFTPAVDVVESIIMPAEDTTIVVKYVENGKGVARFYNEGILFDTTADYIGNAVIFPGEVPTKAATKEASYVFSYWKLRLPEDTVATLSEYVYTEDDLEFDAVYDEIPNPQYTVTFLNYDESVIDSTKGYTGDNVNIPAAPERESTDTVEYIFKGWALFTDQTSEILDEIPETIGREDVVYIAVFEEEEIEIIDEPEIPQSEPEDEEPADEEPADEEPTVEEPADEEEEVIEDVDIPQDDPVVPQTGDGKALPVAVGTFAALALAILAFFGKKRR